MSIDPQFKLVDAFCLDVLSIIERGVLRSPAVFVLLSISLFSSVNGYFIYLCTLMLGEDTHVIILSFLWLGPFIIV